MPDGRRRAIPSTDTKYQSPFGLIQAISDFHALAERLSAAGTRFVVEPWRICFTPVRCPA
ncbi:hypothetical protein [Streptomyces sp. A30]|uniref:hypothetical protein n=1 Tax=Streptomyces sp. A30 TaxID=2789273 RepID=UPI00397FB288